MQWREEDRKRGNTIEVQEVRDGYGKREDRNKRRNGSKTRGK